MASLNITDSSYEVTKKTIVINYTTDVTLDNVQLSKDGVDFIDASSFSQVSALFDISSWGNGNYDNCVLRGSYENVKILIGVTEIVMDEGETRTFGVSLSKKILNDVVINIENSDESVVTIDKTSLTFTPDNYDKIQNIEVVGVHNPDDVNKIANITLSNENMTSKEVPIYVNNIDVYRGEIVLNTTNISVNENSTAIFTVKLDRKPTNNQIVRLSCENENATIDKSSLTFTPSNYNTTQTVTVTGVYDNSLNDKTCVIALTSNEVNTQSINVTIKNIDHFGNIVLNNTSLSIDEGNTTTFTVELDSMPSENQTVSISCDNSYVTIDKPSLTFTPSNYDTTQTVTISSVHNESDYVDRTTIITLSSPNVENKTITVTVNNIDVRPEVFGNIVTSTNTLSVNEDDVTTFTVKLDQEPTNNQIINLSANNNNNITLDKTSLTFTPSDYNTPQTVTVSGVYDSSSFDDKTSIITLSSDNVNDSTINVTIVNIDKHTIVNNLTNCTNSNSITEIAHNEAYSATISANPNAEMESITVTMGGVDITSTSVTQYNITIPNVTGDVIITANAQQTAIKVPTTTQGYVTMGSGGITNSETYVTCGYVDVSRFISTGVRIQINSSKNLLIDAYGMYNKKKGYIRGEDIKVTELILTSDDLFDVTYMRVTLQRYTLTNLSPSANDLIVFTPLS